MSDESSGGENLSDKRPDKTDKNEEVSHDECTGGECEAHPNTPCINVTVNSHNSDEKPANNQRGRHDKLALFFDGITSIGVIVAVAIAIWAGISARNAAEYTKEAADAVWKQIEQSDKHFTAAERAWLAPVDLVNKEGAFDLERSQEVRLLFRNTGQTPATKTDLNYRAFIVPNNKIREEGFIDKRFRALTGGQDCKSRKPKEDGYVIFPTSGPPEIARVLVKHEWANALNNRQQFLIVVGCFAYETFSTPHRSYFCLFFDHREDQPPKDWAGTRCPAFKEYAD